MKQRKIYTKKRKKISYTLRQIIFARDRWTCQYCNKLPSNYKIEIREFRPFLIPVDEFNKDFEIDHINAVSNGGDNNINNLATSCYKCNHNKSNRKWKLSKNFPKIRLFKEVK